MTKVGRPRIPIEHKFWSYVNKTDDCWLWKHKGMKGGYGRFQPNYDKKKAYQAHRYSWMLAYGDIPDALCVLHHCDTPACVRPDHLFLGTRADNCHDMMAKGRKPKLRQLGLRSMSPQLVREIRQARACGMTYDSIAKKFELSDRTVWLAVNRKRYADVE